MVVVNVGCDICSSGESVSCVTGGLVDGVMMKVILIFMDFVAMVIIVVNEEALVRHEIQDSGGSCGVCGRTLTLAVNTRVINFKSLVSECWRGNYHLSRLPSFLPS